MGEVSKWTDHLVKIIPKTGEEFAIAVEGKAVGYQTELAPKVLKELGGRLRNDTTALLNLLKEREITPLVLQNLLGVLASRLSAKDMKSVEAPIRGLEQRLWITQEGMSVDDHGVAAAVAKGTPDAIQAVEEELTALPYKPWAQSLKEEARHILKGAKGDVARPRVEQTAPRSFKPEVIVFQALPSPAYPLEPHRVIAEAIRIYTGNPNPSSRNALLGELEKLSKAEPSSRDLVERGIKSLGIRQLDAPSIEMIVRLAVDHGIWTEAEGASRRSEMIANAGISLRKAIGEKQPPEHLSGRALQLYIELKEGKPADALRLFGELGGEKMIGAGINALRLATDRLSSSSGREEWGQTVIAMHQLAVEKMGPAPLLDELQRLGEILGSKELKREMPAYAEFVEPFNTEQVWQTVEGRRYLISEPNTPLVRLRKRGRAQRSVQAIIDDAVVLLKTVDEVKRSGESPQWLRDKLSLLNSTLPFVLARTQQGDSRALNRLLKSLDWSHREGRFISRPVWNRPPPTAEKRAEGLDGIERRLDSYLSTADRIAYEDELLGLYAGMESPAQAADRLLKNPRHFFSLLLTAIDSKRSEFLAPSVEVLRSSDAERLRQLLDPPLLEELIGQMGYAPELDDIRPALLNALSKIKS